LTTSVAIVGVITQWSYCPVCWTVNIFSIDSSENYKSQEKEACFEIPSGDPELSLRLPE